MSKPAFDPMEPTEAEIRAIRNRLQPNDPEAHVIWGYLARVGRLGMTTHVAGDPYQSAFFEGKRTIVLKLAELVGMSPMDFLRRN